MLVVNAAVAARRAGHDVVVYTSHHDEGRCFKETTGEGGSTRSFGLSYFSGYLSVVFMLLHVLERCCVTCDRR